MTSLRIALVLALALSVMGCTKKAKPAVSADKTVPSSGATADDDGGGGWTDLLKTGAEVATRHVLGAEEGALFYAYDMLAYPSEPTKLTARIHDSRTLSAIAGVTVTFYKDEDALIGSAVTDEDGAATVEVVPNAVGDYYFSARITEVIGGLPKELLNVGPTPLLVATRDKDTSFIIVDLDHTVVDSSFLHVLAGSAKPMADSQDVLGRLAKRYSLIYMTHRPEEMGRSTKQWLIDKGFPRAPLLMSQKSDLVRGSGTYKTERLAEILRAFPNVQIGIGDKISDTRAYLDNGLTAYLIPHYKRKPDDMREMADKIATLPQSDSLHVVNGWEEIEVGVFHNMAYPADRFIERLRRRADEIEWEDGEDDEDDDEDDEDDDEDDD